MGLPDMRNTKGQFRPGVSGHPGGIFKKLREVQMATLTGWAPHTNRVMQRLLDLCFDDDSRVSVAAASKFLEHASPAIKQSDAKPEDSDQMDQGEAVAKAMDALLSRPETREQLRSRLEVLDGGKR